MPAQRNRNPRNAIAGLAGPAKILSFIGTRTSSAAPTPGAADSQDERPNLRIPAQLIRRPPDAPTANKPRCLVSRTKDGARIFMPIWQFGRKINCKRQSSSGARKMDRDATKVLGMDPQ